MNKASRILAALPAVIFLVLGLRWLIDPSAAAQMLGMPLLDGIGRSSQIGDMSAYFIGGSIMIFASIITQQRIWLQAAALLISLTAVFRIIAWLFHDAALATDLIAPEILFTGLLLFAAAQVSQEK
jgi:hypothetical protein